MSVLVIQIPPRQRLGPRAAVGEEAPVPAPAAGVEYGWVRTENGTTVAGQGRCAPALLPPADVVVAVLADSDVSWQRVVLPKAPSAKLRAALAGVTEELLLDEPDSLHLAIGPDAVAGSPAWIAAADRAWLEAELRAIEQGGARVARVVPSLWPSELPQGHFFDAAAPGSTPEPAIAMADANGIVCLPLAGSLARALLPAAGAQAQRWTAPPAVAAAAERWLGSPVIVENDGERLLAAARSTWNLRQFELAPRRRGSRALRDAVRRFMSPAWRPVRVGLVALAALQIVGLNAWAWSQRQAVQDKRAAQVALLAQVHPQVRAVVDAPLQMERENDQLRARAGQPGTGDLESMLAAAAAAWPDGQGPVQSLRFQPGQLTLANNGWSDNDLQQFSTRLRPGGWSVESAPGRVTMSRSATPARTGSAP